MLIKHPLNIEKRMYPIQDVLRDLANQEHGDVSLMTKWLWQQTT